MNGKLIRLTRPPFSLHASGSDSVMRIQDGTKRKDACFFRSLLDLKEIECEVKNLARLIKVPQNELPTFGYSNDFAHPHIEVNNNGYNYVIVERGEELNRNVTDNIHELLYWVFEKITIAMALQYTLKNRILNQDSRRMAFEKQEELLRILNPEWEIRTKFNHQKILKEHPFDDLAGLRASYCAQLRKKGINEKEIMEMAYDKYPRV